VSRENRPEQAASTAYRQLSALVAVDDGDRIACENAARDADQIGELLARSA
jgi:hypothetical protein